MKEQANLLNKFKKQSEIKKNVMIEDLSEISKGKKIIFSYTAENVLEYEERKKKSQKKLIDDVIKQLKKKGIKANSLSSDKLIEVAIEKLGETEMDQQYSDAQVEMAVQWFDSFEVISSEEVKKYFEKIFPNEKDSTGKEIKVSENKFNEYVLTLVKRYEDFLEELNLDNIDAEDDDITP